MFTHHRAADHAPASIRRFHRPAAGQCVLAAIGVVLAAAGVVLSSINLTNEITGAARPQTVTVTVTGHAYVHPADGACTVGGPNDGYTVTLSDLAGWHRVGTLSAGHLVGTTCVFTATMPALADATSVTINGAVHAVPGGVGTLALSADDGHWTRSR